MLRDRPRTAGSATGRRRECYGPPDGNAGIHAEGSAGRLRSAWPPADGMGRRRAAGAWPITRPTLTGPAHTGPPIRVILACAGSAGAAHDVIAEGLERGAGGDIGQPGDLGPGGRGPAPQVA